MTEEEGSKPLKQRKPRFRNVLQRVKVVVGKLKQGISNIETSDYVFDGVGGRPRSGAYFCGETVPSTSIRRAVSSHAATGGEHHDKSDLERIDDMLSKANFALPDFLQVNHDEISDISSVTTEPSGLYRGPRNNFFDYEMKDDMEIDELFESFEAALDGALNGMLGVVGNGVQVLSNSKASCSPNGCTGMPSVNSCSEAAIVSPIIQCADNEQDEKLKSMMDDFLCRDERSLDSFSKLNDLQAASTHEALTKTGDVKEENVHLQQVMASTNSAEGDEQFGEPSPHQVEEDALQQITNLFEKAEEDLELVLGSLDRPKLINSEGIEITDSDLHLQCSSDVTEVNTIEEGEQDQFQNPRSSLSRSGSICLSKNEKKPRLQRKRFELKLEPLKLQQNILRRFRRKHAKKFDSTEVTDPLSSNAPVKPLCQENSVVLTESGGEESGSKETAGTHKDSDSASGLYKITVLNLSQEDSAQKPKEGMISRVAAEDAAFAPVIQPQEVPKQGTQHDSFHLPWLNLPNEIGLGSLW